MYDKFNTFEGHFNIFLFIEKMNIVEIYKKEKNNFANLYLDTSITFKLNLI